MMPYSPSSPRISLTSAVRCLTRLLKNGDYAAAITLAGSAFESLLKTICNENGWNYDSQKDTCSKLVGHCKERGVKS
jgi:hypothetical protein